LLRNLIPMVEEYLNINKDKDREIEDEYVYDIYYRHEVDIAPQAAENLPSLIWLRDEDLQEDDKSEIDEEDADSNAEDYYGNDYPDEEYSSEEQDEYDDSF